MPLYMLWVCVGVFVASFPNVTFNTKQDVSDSTVSTTSINKAVVTTTTAQAVTNNDLVTLQQEENFSISGSNARLMIMKKLSRNSKAREHRNLFTIVCH